MLLRRYDDCLVGGPAVCVQGALHSKFLVALGTLVPDLLVDGGHMGAKIALAGRLEVAVGAGVADPEVDLLLVQPQALQRVGDVVAVLTFELDAAVEGLDVLVERAGGRGLKVAVVAGMFDALVDGLDVLLEIAGRGRLIVAMGAGVPQAQVHRPVMGLEPICRV